MGCSPLLWSDLMPPQCEVLVLYSFIHHYLFIYLFIYLLLKHSCTHTKYNIVLSHVHYYYNYLLDLLMRETFKKSLILCNVLLISMFAYKHNTFTVLYNNWYHNGPHPQLSDNANRWPWVKLYWRRCRKTITLASVKFKPASVIYHSMDRVSLMDSRA